MRRILLIACTLSFVISCTKDEPPATIIRNPVTPRTPVTPVTPAPPGWLMGPLLFDTLGDWVVIRQAASTLEDIWFTGNNIGFTTNDTVILTSTDNGNSWKPVANTTFPQIFNIQFLDNQNGFIQGFRLGTTHDGGSTWSFRPLPLQQIINFQFVSITTGYFIEYGGNTIYKTSDGGSSWQNKFGFSGLISSFYFLDSLNGFSMNASGFSKTTDGDSTWQIIGPALISNADSHYFFKMQFLDGLNGYCATANGLFKTTDGGVTWANSLITKSTFMIPYFMDKNNGYCLAQNIIYKTTDGGNTWTISCQLTNKDSFSGCHFLDMNTGWASTFGGYILKLK